MKNVGVQSIGIKLPIIREGDDLLEIIIGAILKSDVIIENNDVIGITESIVARAQGNYVTVDDIVQFLKEKHIMKKIYLDSPIMSRNRFSIILKAFARYADEITIILDGEHDEQGNPNYGTNPFTGVDIQEYYKEICRKEHCKLDYISESDWHNGYIIKSMSSYIDCRCHPKTDVCINLKSLMNLPVTRLDGSKSGYNTIFGLLGSNKATDDKLKLFPNRMEAQKLVDDLKQFFKYHFAKDVEVMIYGDGCFKDPIGGIWEFADPVVSPAYTEGLVGTPNEIKIKAFADDQFKDLNGDELDNAIKETIKTKDSNLVGKMSSQGTTPRRYIDLLGSLMDLTSGSGDKGTPVVIVKNYFNKYSD